MIGVYAQYVQTSKPKQMLVHMNRKAYANVCLNVFKKNNARPSEYTGEFRTVHILVA